MKSENLAIISDSREVLRRVAVSQAKDNPLGAAFLGWLLPEESWQSTLVDAAERASAVKGAERSTRNVAVLGFASSVGTAESRFAEPFVQQLEWCMGLPNFATGGEPCGAVADPLNFAGIVAGSEKLAEGQLQDRFLAWAKTVWKDATSLIPDEGWRRKLLNCLGQRLGLLKLSDEQADEPLWFFAALQRSGWTSQSENRINEVLKAAIMHADETKDGFEAGLRIAAIEWAVARATDFDVTTLALADMGKVLQRVPTVFQRWIWEDKPRTARRGAEARRWYIENEYHFQSLLYVILKPLVPALEEEQYLKATGTYQPRADLCILSLELVVEVKFWYQTKSVKDLTEELAADLTLYLRPDSPYRNVIAVIWDDCARTEEHDELRRGIKGFKGMFDVVIVNRPSCMNDGSANATKGKQRAKT